MIPPLKGLRFIETEYSLVNSRLLNLSQNPTFGTICFHTPAKLGFCSFWEKVDHQLIITHNLEDGFCRLRENVRVYFHKQRRPSAAAPMVFFVMAVNRHLPECCFHTCLPYRVKQVACQHRQSPR